MIVVFVQFLAAFAAMFLLGAVTSWIDRKVTARIQARIGPPWYQPFADVLKLLGKEPLLPDGASRLIFLGAPLAGLAGAAVAAAILGVTLVRPESGFVGDIIALIYFLLIPSLALIMGASAAGSPITGIGAAREIKLIIGYELPFLVVIAMAVMKSGFDFRLGNIVAAQTMGGWHLRSLSGILGFAVMILTIQAKLGRVPFDMPEAEQEIMGGIIAEYSGPFLAMIQITKLMMLSILPLFAVTLFLGGIHLQGWGILWSILKYLAVVVLVVLIRNTNPRLRIDQALAFFWGPAALLALAGLGLSFAGW
jgi:NADH-quinone oxidoreductase subunit H